ncbi:hypothetical protein SADUNF_Sadunf09G0011100 [Salix dunnii]|uniref:RNA 3'-terminal phosphate cyclase domain-containing protein n=1 Tax=Salix dunnii TaxID=1413687 RepID=A0A835JTG9_9ROSI|nr:hypothetical protein SADUNF_Sadunf09G0011100 [Salix dunnii]
MGKVSYKKLRGSQNLRQRLLLASLSATPVQVEDIRANDTDMFYVAGIKFQYRPGIVMGGRHLVHDCGVNPAIGYFLKPLVVLGLFSKKPLSIRLKGITYDSRVCVETFRSATLPLLKQFGVPSEGLELKIESRGVPPHGGREVLLSVPIIRSLTAVTRIDEGMVMRIRGVTFSTRVSSQFENTMIHAA